MNLTCKEWGTLPIDENLPESAATRLHSLAKQAARRLKLPETAVLSRHHQCLKAGQVVGLLAASSQTLEILPKIDGDEATVRHALIRMLAVALDVRIADGELANLHAQRRDFLEILIGLFATRLLAAVRRGLPRRYLIHEDDLPRLRGKLNVIRQFTHLAIRPDQLACRYDELSPDTPLNRLLKAATNRMAGIARSAANARRLADALARFEQVGDSPNPLREPVRLDRTNAAFHDLHQLARLFLSGDWQTTTSGAAQGFALLFPMNDLFEKFIGRSLVRTFGSGAARLQDRSHHALKNETESIFEMKPDALVEWNGTVIIDTKWKELKHDDQPKLGIDQRDVYQMLAYSQAYGANRLILLYPWHSKLGEEPGVIRRWRVAGSTRCKFDVAAIDIRQTTNVGDALKRIVTENRNTHTTLAIDIAA